MVGHASQTSTNWRSSREPTPGAQAPRNPKRHYQRIETIELKNLVPGVIINAPLHTADFSDNEGRPNEGPFDKFRTLAGIGTWVYSKFRLFVLLRKYSKRHAILIPIFTHDKKGLTGKPLGEYIGIRDDATVGEARTLTESPHGNIFVRRTPQVIAQNKHTMAVSDTAYAHITAPMFWAMNNPAEINGHLRLEDLVRLKDLFAEKLLGDDEITVPKPPTAPATADEESQVVSGTETVGALATTPQENQEVSELRGLDLSRGALDRSRHIDRRWSEVASLNSGEEKGSGAQEGLNQPATTLAGHGGPPVSPSRTRELSAGRGALTRGGRHMGEMDFNAQLSPSRGISSGSNRLSSYQGKDDSQKRRGIRGRGRGRGRGTGSQDPAEASFNTGEEVQEDNEEQKGFEWSLGVSGFRRRGSMNAVGEQSSHSPSGLERFEAAKLLLNRRENEFEGVEGITRKRKEEVLEEYSENSGVKVEKSKRRRIE